MGIIKSIKQRLLNKLFTNIYILSDSHGVVFYNVNFRKAFRKRVRSRFCVIQGATASGLANPNSKTKANEKFNVCIKKAKAKDYILFELGEVDCGFSIWLSSQKRKIPIKEQLDFTLKNYYSLIKKASDIVGKKIIVCSAVLPTIQDDYTWGEVANQRKNVNAKIYDRTRLTLEFNKELNNFCKKNNYIYWDFDSFLLDKDTKLVKKRFLNSDPSDHHLNPIVFSQSIEKYIKKYGKKSVK